MAPTLSLSSSSPLEFIEREDVCDSNQVDWEETKAEDEADRVENATRANTNHNKSDIRYSEGTWSSHHFRYLGKHQGSWCERINKQTAHEDCVTMDEGAAEASVNLQSHGTPQAVPLHNLVHKPQNYAFKTKN